MAAPSLATLQADHIHELAKGCGPGVQQTFLMTTGLECSYPTVEGGRRRDELEGTRHYARWREDFELCRALGARYVRYGPPYYRMHTAPGRYDWSWTDMVLPVMWDEGLIPILDLCHFGVPDWVGSFQNKDWPQHFAEYAAAFAERYPWIKFYTPVNEMLVCSRFSALEGIWNEQEKNDRAFVQAHTNMCRATLLAIEAILHRRPDAVFIQSEETQVYLERWPGTEEAVEFRNHRRFMTFDVLYGREPDGDVLMYLLDNGVSEDEHRWFMRKGRVHAAHCVLGTDYYWRNERTVEPGGKEKAEGSMLGWGMIAVDYFRRYHRPMMLTETNMADKDRGEAKDWLLKTWHQVKALRNRGVPVIGYTWYSLTDQIDWDINLRKMRGVVNANGLVDLDRTERETARIYRDLALAYGRDPLVHTLPPSLCGGTL